MTLKPRPVILIAPLHSRRVKAFQETLNILGWPPAQILGYQQILEQPGLLPSILQAGHIIKLDSSGEDCATERLLLALGYQNPEDLSHLQIEEFDIENGRLLPTAQWYRGLQKFLSHLEQQLSGAAVSFLRTWNPDDVLTMFDKRLTQQRFQQAGLPVPGILAPCTDYTQLRDNMRDSGWSRVFIKLAHSSSAAGTIALETTHKALQATSTIEMEGAGYALRLYNSRRLRRYRDEKDVAVLINHILLQHPVQIERWLPKMGLEQQTIDLRIVVTAGKATHVIVRSGNGCMTNLHLGNQRGQLQALIHRIGETRYNQVLQLAERAFGCFPDSLYAGLDILLTTTEKPFLLEANAFGDYHRNVFYQGRNTYASQLRALEEYSP